jgi:hypothetical protein
MLDMRIAADGKAKSSLQSAALQNLASVGGGHALAKTMHAHAPSDFWLVCSLRHSNNSVKMMAKKRKIAW